MVDSHNSAISRVRQAIEQANCTEASSMKRYLEALQNKAFMMKQKAFKDDQLIQSVKMDVMGKVSIPVWGLCGGRLD